LDWPYKYHGGLDRWSLDSVPKLAAEWFPAATLDSNPTLMRLHSKRDGHLALVQLPGAEPCVVSSTNGAQVEADPNQSNLLGVSVVHLLLT